MLIISILSTKPMDPDSSLQKEPEKETDPQLVLSLIIAQLQEKISDLTLDTQASNASSPIIENNHLVITFKNGSRKLINLNLHNPIAPSKKILNYLVTNNQYFRE